MARIQLIPDHCDPTIIKNNGEIEIFNIFKNSEGTDDWVVLHSLTLPKHIKQEFGEIDFVVLAPKSGIFCLEVKTKFFEDDGKMYYRSLNRYGELEEEHVNPFAQVKGNEETLRKYFHKDGWERRLLFGYGVMFPSFPFGEDRIDIELEVVYDSDFKKKPIVEYIRKLSKYFNEKCRKLGIRKNLPTVEQVKSIAGQLRSKFQFSMIEIERLKQTKEKIIEFSNEQTKILDYLDESPRILFKGPPGSGKTVIATYAAKRNILQSKRLLFFSFNKLIGYSVQHQLEKYSNDFDFFAGPFNDYLENIVGINYEDYKNKYDKHQYYDDILPDLAIGCLQKKDFHKYDWLIIDDAQDIFRDKYLRILNLLLAGGLKEGKWQLYCDIESQNIFVKDINIEKAIGKVNRDYHPITLKTNYRNSKKIAFELARVFKLNDYNPYEYNEEGKKCKYRYYGSLNEGVKILEEILENIKKNNIPAIEITILSAHLSPYENKNSLVYYLDKNKFKIADISFDDKLFFNTKEITFCSIYRFKGMENSYIIVVDVDNNMDMDVFNNLLCTGMSRPLFSLTVLANNDIRSKFDTLIKSI